MASDIDISIIKKLPNILSDLELHIMNLDVKEREKTKFKLKSKI